MTPDEEHGFHARRLSQRISNALALLITTSLVVAAAAAMEPSAALAQRAPQHKATVRRCDRKATLRAGHSRGRAGEPATTLCGERVVKPKARRSESDRLAGAKGARSAPSVRAESASKLQSGAATVVAQVNATRKQPPKSTGPVPDGIPGSWSLVFDDEFSETSLDTSDWSTGWFGSGITDAVSTYEQDCYDPKQVAVSGGELTITAIQQSETCNGVSQPYTTGAITTDGKFSYTYGAAEARIYLPESGSTISDWPAFWADGQNWPSTGEDDIFEGLAGSPCWTFHYGTLADPLIGGHGCGSFLPGWHTVAADWEPRSITYYYDGVDVGKVTTGVTSAPMYLILDLAVSQAISPPDVTPATMAVDYVRVWQHPS
jgi:beta-glucanase (GH16 family)